MKTFILALVCCLLAVPAIQAHHGVGAALAIHANNRVNNGFRFQQQFFGGAGYYGAPPAAFFGGVPSMYYLQPPVQGMQFGFAPQNCPVAPAGFAGYGGGASFQFGFRR